MTTPRRSIQILCLLLFAPFLLCRAQEQQPASAPAESSAPTLTGSGTSGKIAKFTAATVLGDSVMTETNKRIGLNIAPPTATLHVNGPQPGTQGSISGTNATALLQTSGGKGGNTAASGKTGGKGASISLAAGPGGDAPAGGTNGTGGSITLQPGSAGTGGTGGAAGNVLISPTGDGNVGIGTNATANAKLTIKGPGYPAIVSIEDTLNGGAGIALSIKSATHTGLSSLNTHGVAISGHSPDDTGVQGSSDQSTGVYGESKNGEGVLGRSSFGTGVYGEGTNGAGVHGKSTGQFQAGVSGEGFTGVAGTSASNSTLNAGVLGQNTGGGFGVKGFSSSGVGVYGESDTGKGLAGQSNSSTAILGISTSGAGVHGTSESGAGISGLSPSGYAGLFTGKAKVTTNLEVGGNQFFGNTPRQMINLYNTDYAIGIQNSTLYFRTANTAGYNWYMGGVHSNTQNSPGSGGVSLMRLSSAGNLVVTGSVTATNFANSSDRALKSNFATVNPQTVLDKLAALPVQTWSYRAEENSVRHMGPMAQDFKAAFDLGTDDKHISTVDAAGVTMAAIQALYQQNQELARKVEQLEAQLNRVT
ncbi:MAG TPA: tail fiber domain-containing protein, partial [Pyrinomonadaceae bacterium]|nr:tail fiber domain-containing protein [Pyrinomonadaceae bacterium]